MKIAAVLTLIILNFHSAMAGQVKVNKYGDTKPTISNVNAWSFGTCGKGTEPCLILTASKMNVYVMIKDLKNKGLDPAQFGINLTNLQNIELACDSVLDEINLCVSNTIKIGGRK